MKDKKDKEQNKVAACFDELDREAVNVIYTRVYGVAVNCKSESAFDPVAASAEKTANAGKTVKQRKSS